MSIAYAPETRTAAPPPDGLTETYRTPSDDIALTILCAGSTHTRTLVAEHGRVWRFLRHNQTRNVISVFAECLCPGGHGVAGLPHRAWITADEAHLDLARAPIPTREQVMEDRLSRLIREGVDVNWIDSDDADDTDETPSAD